MSVFLTNLDDFIAPSQACVVVNYKASRPGENKDVASRRIVLSSVDEYNIPSDFSLVRSEKPKAKEGIIKSSYSKSNNESKIASVSLNDCLACRYKPSEYVIDVDVVNLLIYTVVVLLQRRQF